MKVSELIDFLSTVPGDTEVFIDEEMGWYTPKSDHLNYIEAYDVWASDWDNNKTPYTYVCREPSDFVYVRGGGRPDYVHKTLGKRMIVLIG